MERTINPIPYVYKSEALRAESKASETWGMRSSTFLCNSFSIYAEVWNFNDYCKWSFLPLRLTETLLATLARHGVMQGICGYTHLFFNQHCIYLLLNPLWWILGHLSFAEWLLKKGHELRVYPLHQGPLPYCWHGKWQMVIKDKNAN